MKKSTFIAKRGFYLIYDYKDRTYAVDTRLRHLTEQHKIERDRINQEIQKERNNKNV